MQYFQFLMSLRYQNSFLDRARLLFYLKSVGLYLIFILVTILTDIK
jgi:hypothetical protein